MSAFGGKADIAQTSENIRLWPLEVLGLEARENAFQCLHCFLFVQLL